MSKKIDDRESTNPLRLAILLQWVSVGGLVTLMYGLTMAQNARVAYLPLTFDAEAGPIRTSACLQVTERVYAASASWDGINANDGAPERAFKAVIAAIKGKDRAALFYLSDPIQGRDPRRFEQQASAFFQQFGVIELVVSHVAIDT